MFCVQLQLLRCVAMLATFGLLVLVTFLCMMYCAFADPGQMMEEPADLEEGALPRRAHKSWLYPRPILRHDHYCKWVHNVIGLRNHRAFFVMVLGLALMGAVGASVDAYLLASQLAKEGFIFQPVQLLFLLHLGYSLALLRLDLPILQIHVGLISRNELNSEWKEDFFWNAPGPGRVSARELDVDEYNALLDADAFVYDASRNPFDKGVVTNCANFWLKSRSDSLGDW
ncbi:AKR1 [Symbiodinium natans]|uniref:Palmitoyltransferase n=1 Tax=Symbiodinium natans TaxID=878477 RepID=A0A812GVC9_9DINO|nr:AKR1 [Symbiodinium natans]